MSQRGILWGVVTFLRDNVVDPVNRETPYIYVGYPRSSIVAYPIVAVIPTGGDRGPMSMGDTGNRFTLTYQVDIYTDTDTVATISGPEYLVQNELVAYVADLIKNAFRDENCVFRDTYDTLDVWTTPLRILPYTEELDWYRGIFNLTVQSNDPKS